MTQSRFFKAAQIGCFSLVVGLATLTGVAQAQDTGGTTGGTTTTQNNQDDGFDWGWLGLAGLIGLAGLAGLKRDDHRHTTTRTGNRTDTV